MSFWTKQPGIIITAVSLGLIFSLAAASFSWAAQVSANIPFDSWVYPALEKVRSLCRVETSLTGMRPLSRTEVARQLDEALHNVGLYEVPVAATELLRRLKVEFKVELGDQEAGPGPTPVYSVSLHELSARYLYKDGPDSTYSGTNARQFALNYNNNGIEYTTGQNAEVAFQVEARLFKNFMLDWNPAAQIDDDGSMELQTLQGSFTTGWGPISLQIGKQPLWWGQGRHGSLILTNNAEPLTMVRLTNPSPVKLPWLLHYLGPFRFDFFISRLEKNRVVPEPYFGGLRINFRPSPWFEIGASRTAIFGGEGRPSTSIGDLNPFSGSVSKNDTSNSLAAIDVRLTLPWLWNLQLYSEVGGEDETDGLPSKNAYLVGVYLPQLDKSGRWSGSIEYVDTKARPNRPIWYRHHIYQSGYTYHEKIMGHHVGGEARVLAVELEDQFSSDLTLKVGLDLGKRGLETSTEERHLQSVIEIAWRATEQISVTSSFARDRVTFHTSGNDDETSHFLMLRVDYRL